MCPPLVDSGQAALAVLARAHAVGVPFPLILLDAQIPGMDGFSLLARLQQQAYATGSTILMLSSADLSGDMARCRALGISVYLTKPILQSQLWDAIMTALHGVRPDRETAPAAVQSQACASRQRLRILLAEDNPVNQMLTIRLLEKRGDQVEVVDTGKAALAALAQHTFDLVLMDVRMPRVVKMLR